MSIQAHRHVARQKDQHLQGHTELWTYIHIDTHKTNKQMGIETGGKFDR